MQQGPASQPSQTLAAHLRPIAVMALLLVGAVVPISWLAHGLDETRHAGRHLATQVAALLQREATAQPRLWRYDGQKLADQIERLRADGSGLAVAVVDDRGQALAFPAPAAEVPQTPWATWVSAPAIAPASATVWAAMDLRPVWRRVGAMAGGFGGLGVALASLILWLPLRAVRRSEAEIASLVTALQQSRTELSRLLDELEARVVDRSARLVQALAEVRGHEQHVRELAGQALQMQESERRAIARELHDEIGQVLTGVRLQIQVLASTETAQSPRGQTTQRLLTAVDGAIEQTRLAVRRLAPPLLADQGLAVALQQVCAALHSPLGPAIVCQTEQMPRADSAAETAAYRIGQEALTNAVRHAAATHIVVSAGMAAPKATSGAPTLWVQVQDDGCGFDPSLPSSGQGLRSMRDRAELLGGHLSIQADAAGCTVRAELPCTQTNDASGVDCA